MNAICAWRFEDCGWPRYLAEVAGLSRGRNDVTIVCLRPGVILLVELESHVVQASTHAGVPA